MSTSPPSSPYRSSLVVALAILMLGVAAELSMTLWLNHGHFMFSMDDPYIHLALAENIARGHYGVNLHEFSSPSSSIIWPFLLAPFALLDTAPLIILLINVLCGATAIYVAWRALADTPQAGGNQPPAQAATVLAIVLVGLLIAANFLGLIFTGLEHTLQLLCSLSIVAGLIHESEHNKAPWWLWLALLIAPTVRYECLGLVGPALAYLFWRGYYRHTVLLGLATAAMLAGFSQYLVSLNLPWLPNSVMAKLQVTPKTGGAAHFLAAINANVNSDRGQLLAVGILLLLYQSIKAHQPAPRRGLAMAIATSACLHLLVGRNGWYGRYENYIYGAVLLALAHLYKDAAIAAIQSKRLNSIMAGALVLAASLLLAQPYFHTLYTTPWAARNVYLQQHQLHRFVVDYYQKPVALNDLGWVAYRNDREVLDLYGLASTEALQARYQGQDKLWMSRLAQRKGVKLAMLYEAWFPDTPASWIRMGQLDFKGKVVTSAFNSVAFYATDCAEFLGTQAALDAFAQSLPVGASFTKDARAALRCTPPAQAAM
jgi:hypothetical protein